MPEASPAERIANLLDTWKTILEALTGIFGPICLAPPTTTRPSKLKHYEDMLDAVVCAWVGVAYVEGRATAYGDATAAIWCPQSSVPP